MAWSYAARIEGRDGNSVQEAINFVERVNQPAIGEGWFQPSMF